MTISVPSELRARLDKVVESVNWSAIACRAFEDKLAEIAKKKEKKEMSDVIDRLRASARKSEAINYKEGYRVGQRWAQHKAEYAQLKRLKKFKDGIDDDHSLDWATYFQEDHRRSDGPGTLMVRNIAERGEELTPTVVRELWDQLAGTNAEDMLYDADFPRGFADGALDVLANVEDEL